VTAEAPYFLPLWDVQREGGVVEGDVFCILPMTEGGATPRGMQAAFERDEDL